MGLGDGVESAVTDMRRIMWLVGGWAPVNESPRLPPQQGRDDGNLFELQCPLNDWGRGWLAELTRARVSNHRHRLDG